MCKDALHVLCNITVLLYDERLSLLGLERLELRRLKFYQTELFKIVNGFTTSRIYVYNLLKLILCTIREGIVLN